MKKHFINMYLSTADLACLQVSVVHICEATLKKRLVEFESTESGSLTVSHLHD